jgi:hypothetical protein
MAYMNQEKKKVIAANLKPILAKYKIKSSLRVRDYSSIELTIKSSPIDFLGNHSAEQTRKHGENSFPERNYLDVNVYWFQDHFTGIAKEILAELVEALRSAGYYNNSDYFDVAYYYNISIGDWDKPYLVK